MLKLVIANKLYSSWSMRPWLVAKAFGIPFEEIVIPLRQPDTSANITAISPAGKVPILIDGDLTVWDSLAIIEYLAETFPDKAIWPREKGARARARAISAEMHSGFQALRQACPMNFGKVFETPAMTDDLQAAIARIEDIFADAMARSSASGGPFLFGDFCAADAMFAPIVVRFSGYQVRVTPLTRRYMDTVQGHPAFQQWRTAALAEPWTIDAYEAGLTPVRSFR